jgi:hypothetical protein
MKKKSLFGLAGILFLSITFFACSEASNTAKVLRDINNATSRRWAENIDKFGIDYADETNMTILALALEAKNPVLISAIVKDKANLYRKYRNSQGVELYPLRYLIYSADSSFNDSEAFGCAKILLDAGTELKFFMLEDRQDPLLLAWFHYNEELVQLLLPAYKKDNMLDYSNYPLDLMITFIGELLSAMTGTDWKERADKIWNITELLADSGVQISGEALSSALAKRREETSSFGYERFNSEAVDLLRSMATGQVTAPNTTESPSNPVGTNTSKLYYSTTNLRLRNEPDASKDNRIASIPEGDSVELLEVGDTTTMDGINAPWYKVKTADGTIGWVFSGYLSDVKN